MERIAGGITREWIADPKVYTDIPIPGDEVRARLTVVTTEGSFVKICFFWVDNTWIW